MKKPIVVVVIIAVVIAISAVFAPQLCHRCDECDSFFVGTGYKGNVLSDILLKQKVVICRECAEFQYSIPLSFGMPLENVKYRLFE